MNTSSLFELNKHKQNTNSNKSYVVYDCSKKAEILEVSSGSAESAVKTSGQGDCGDDPNRAIHDNSNPHRFDERYAHVYSNTHVSPNTHVGAGPRDCEDSSNPPRHVESNTYPHVVSNTHTHVAPNTPDKPKEHYDLIILVIASHSSLYDKFYSIWNRYDSLHPNIKVFYVYAKPFHNTESSREPKNPPLQKDLIANCEESLIPGVLVKTISALTQIDQNYSYNFILRTNLSSFFRFDKLYNHITSSGPIHKGIYEGVAGTHLLDNNVALPFVSGAGILMSKDIVQLLLENQSDLNYALIDDVAIADFMKRHGIPIRAMNHLRYDFLNARTSNLSEVSIQRLPHFHFRIKNRKMREVLDVSVMEKLYKSFYINSNTTND